MTLLDYMGYELVKLNETYEPYEVIDWDDPNYFRLNAEVIGRARRLALWGAGVILNKDMMNYATEVATLIERGPTVEQLSKVNTLDAELRVEWIKPFTTNNKKNVSREHCLLFAVNLEKALDIIQGSPIRPYFEVDLLRDFIEFLNESPNGVWLE